MTNLKVNRIAFIKPSLHFVDRLQSVLVKCLEILYPVLGEEWTCHGPVHPVAPPVSGGHQWQIFASLPQVTCGDLEHRSCEDKKTGLAISIENTFSEN